MHRCAALIVALASCGRIDFVPVGQSDGDAFVGDGLTSRGVLVRYFLDEADSGQAVTTVRDAMLPGFDLTMKYDTATSPVWTTTPTGRGLAFDTLALDGGACADVAGKVLALDSRTEATIEVHAAYTACDAAGSRYVHIGEANLWTFSLGCYDATTTVFGFNDAVNQQQTFTVPATSPITLTLVYDSMQPVQTERVALYANGARAAVLTPGRLPTLGETLLVGTTHSLCVANRAIGMRSPIGSIGYAAYYAVALTPDEILANASRLAVSDDP